VRLAIIVTTLVFLGTEPLPLSAQSRDWAVDYLHGHAATSTNDVPSTWTTDWFETMWQRVGHGGWLASVERQERHGVTDVALSTHTYRQDGDWTFAADVTGAPRAHFLRAISAGGEVSHRSHGATVLSGAYHYVRFPGTVVQQMEPALAFYHRRGNVEARAFVTRDLTHDITFAALLIRALYDVTPRVQFGGGAAIGEGIFFLEPNATRPQLGSQFYGTVRLGLTDRDFIAGSLSVAGEEPAFTYHSLSLGYKRTF
jgi:YaiO family outer membrane protein